MTKETLKNIIDVATGRRPADLCIRNSKIIDVFNKEIFSSDVYIKDGYFAGFGNSDFPVPSVIFDAEGAYMAPGFIDSHVHIESSHVSPAEFSKLVIPHGTTTVIADPHEIGNVCGLDGFDYMVEATENLPLSAFIQFPSCVPTTHFENSGAILKAAEIASRITNPRVLGLGELMDYKGVESLDPDVLDKIMVCRQAGKIIDGHSPGIGGSALDAYGSCGIRNDHECATASDLRDRTRRGIYVLLRQGTVCHDLVNLCKGVDEKNSSWCLMCTDDCQAKTIIDIGHIDNNVRMAIGEGIDPITAICMATINAATCFKLDDRGAIAPGRRADFVLFKDLNDIRIDEVFTAGEHVASHGKALFEPVHASISRVSGKVNVKDYSIERFALPLKSNRVKTIKVIPGSVVTEIGHVQVNIENGCWVRNDEDVVKIAVVERHNGTGNIGIGLLENFGLKGGAVATSVAHDSHNIIVAGDNDADMSLAVSELVRLGGGMSIVKGGSVLYSVGHEIAGLMTDLPGEEVAEKLAKIEELARKELCINEGVDPYMTLCFMSLPVIPDIKVTDLGVFDVREYTFVPVED